MLKVRLGDIFVANQLLGKIQGSKIESFKVSYKLGKLLDHLGKELQLIDKQRFEIIKKYGKLVENQEDPTKNYWTMVGADEETNKLFTKEMENLLDTEVEINALPFEEDDFDKVYEESYDEASKLPVYKLFKLTPQDAMKLKPFMKE